MSTSVLVVENDPRAREEIGSWLELEGFDVISCPGPIEPCHVCVAATAGRCPLEEDADVVVLDMHLASDESHEGMPAWELLLFYIERGDPVVVLSGFDDSVRPRPDDGVAVIRRPAERKELVHAVRALTRQTARGGR